VFLDSARVVVKAGDGGRGVISFRREAHVPRGGPDGGDGGKGGDVVFRVDPELGTLAEFRFAHEVAARSGGAGAGRKQTGKAGTDLVVRVPVGTVVVDEATGRTVRRAPRIAEDGGKGERRAIRLELKLLADVGLTGLPNAGKSTLLAALTSARPKIADYPFTTLVPNLGVARFDDRELVVADIPGLIEGASRGLGLGEEFLRHVERTRLLVHVVDAARPDPLADIATIDAELAAYGHGLAERPRIFALNKRDLPEAAAALPALEAALRSTGREPIAISAATRAGVLDLERRIFTLCPPRPAPAATTVSERRIAFAGGAQDFHVVRERDGFRVSGDRVERLAAGIDWESADATAYFHRQLARSGVERKLRALGVREGDTVRIGARELEWKEAPAQ